MLSLSPRGRRWQEWPRPLLKESTYYSFHNKNDKQHAVASVTACVNWRSRCHCGGEMLLSIVVGMVDGRGAGRGESGASRQITTHELHPLDSAWRCGGAIRGWFDRQKNNPLFLLFLREHSGVIPVEMSPLPPPTGSPPNAHFHHQKEQN